MPEPEKIEHSIDLVLESWDSIPQQNLFVAWAGSAVTMNSENEKPIGTFLKAT
jgi:hypothetical protein